VLRNVAGKIDGLHQLEQGFPNFYGMQRFGTGMKPTSQMGLALLRRDFRETVQLVLGSRARKGTMREAFELAQQGDFRAALDRTPRSCLQEFLVLQHLAESPGDFSGALKCVPRHLRLLWCRALGSQIWNQVLSLRIQEKMMEPLVGDLVYGEGGAVRSLRRGEERDTPMWAVLMPVPGYDVQMPE
ncbi:unnamed protein product, partial [Effrenium voratum]